MLRGLLNASVLAGAALVGVVPGPATAAASGPGSPAPVALTPVAAITSATALATRRGDRAVYVARQDGTVLAVTRRPGRSKPRVREVADLTARVTSGGERGLLGLAFAPDGRRLYVNYTRAGDGATVVESFPMARRRARVDASRVVLTVPQPQANHNGGQLSFGPDGYLYIGLGDGGGAGDEGPGHAPGGNAQSRDALLGKILRIDPRPRGPVPYTVPGDNPYVDGTGRAEIWVSGVRNPWRFSFDTATGELWVADVGQNAVEEVTRLSREEARGANLGWNLFEGRTRYRDGPNTEPATKTGTRTGTETGTDVVDPVLVLDHRDGYCSVTGGFVYRGSRLAGLHGWYVFSDYCDGTIRAARVAADGTVQLRDLGVTLDAVATFGQDEYGELYVVSQTDGVFQLVPGPGRC